MFPDFPSTYVTHRKHYLCSSKPEIPNSNIPNINSDINLEEYLSIVTLSAEIVSDYEEKSISEESTDIEDTQENNINEFQITPTDVEKYSKSYMNFNGQEQNMLTLLINKARDLNICQRYQDGDLKSLGRGYSYRSPFV